MIILSRHRFEQERIVELALMTAPGDPYAACARPRGLDPRGLRYGAGLWSQASGDLGRLLLHFEMLGGVSAVFGGERERAALLDVLTRSPQELRSADGDPVWSARWVRCFYDAGQHPHMRRAQRMLLRDLLMGRTVKEAKRFHLSAQADLARVFCRQWQDHLRRQLRGRGRSRDAYRIKTHARVGAIYGL